MSWQNLPQHVADCIFKNFTTRGLKALSLVCRSWLTSIDVYWRDDIILDGEYLTTKENLDTFSKSLRYIVNLQLSDVAIEQCREIFQILRNRETNNVCYLKSLTLYEYAIEDVFEILKLTGKSLESLTISFADSDDFKIDKDSEYIFENLSSVKKLTLDYPEKAFLQATKYIRKLDNLKIGTPNDGYIDVFKTLIEDNYETLRNLRLHSQPFSEQDLTYLEKIKSLEKLDFSTGLNAVTNAHRKLIKSQGMLKCLCLRTNDITDEDLDIIRSQLTKLEDFIIDGSLRNLTKKNLETIWNMDSLKSLELHGCIFPKADLLHILSPKTKLKKLVFCRSTCDDDIVEMFLKNSPQLEFLDVILVEGKHPSFRIIQEAANCLSLKYLSIHSHNLSSTENLSTKPFSKLEELVLYNSKIDEQCYLEIKAAKLKSINLTSMYKLTDESLRVISSNCPKIEELSLSCDVGVTDLGVKELSQNLKYLRQLSCYTNRNITLDSVSSIVNNCKYLELCDFGPLQTIYKDRPEFEKILLEICNSKYTLRMF